MAHCRMEGDPEYFERRPSAGSRQVPASRAHGVAVEQARCQLLPLGSRFRENVGFDGAQNNDGLSVNVA